MLLRVEHHDSGPRVWLLGCRVHHAHTGALCVAGGAWLIWADRQDIKTWLRAGRQTRPAERRSVTTRTLPGAETVGVTTSHGVW